MRMSQKKHNKAGVKIEAKFEMVWTRTEEGCWIGLYREQYGEDGVVRHKKEKTKDNVNIYSKNRHPGIHVQRIGAGYIRNRVLRMELSGKRRRRRAKRMCMYVVRVDIQAMGVTGEGAEERRRRRQMIYCGDP